MSYYKIINGAKYDKQLWELATEFTTGEGAGSISQREMQLIVKLAQDGRGITAIEKATLYYIRAHFDLTEAAAAWFDTQFPPQNGLDVPALLQRIIVAEFQLPGLQALVNAADITAQERLPHNHISFEQALRATLTSLLKDATDVESPRSIVEAEHGLSRDQFHSEEAWDAALTTKVREYFAEKAELALHPARPLTDEEELYIRPEGGETTHDYWIFQLRLRTLSDHIFWAITDRRGAKPTYNYGFN